MFRLEIGEHIELRALEEYHAEEIFAAVERNREHLRRWLPWVDRTRAIEDVQGFLAGAIEAFGRGEEMHAGIFIHGKLAGTLGHHRIDAHNRNVSIGYWLDATVEGKGVMRASDPVATMMFFASSVCVLPFATTSTRPLPCKVA